MIVSELLVVANWRLNTAKSPAAVLQEETARAPYTLRVASGSARYARSHVVRTHRFAGGCRTYVALYSRSQAVRTYIPEVG